MEEPHSHLLDLSDSELVALVSQRDVAACSLLFDRYSRPVYVLAAHMLDPAEAEEVVQEVFLRLWQKAHQYQAERGSFYAWLMSIARHHVLDRLRQLNRQSLFDRVGEIDWLLETADLNVNVEEEAWQRDMGKLVLHVLKGLPVEQRRALVLAYFSGLSQSAIAEHLGWPLGTVKKRIRLGLQKLRKALAQKGLVVDEACTAATEDQVRDH